MKKRCSWILTPAVAVMVILICIPNSLDAQFEQRLSLNLSGGIFKTLGWPDYQPEMSDPDYWEPTLMPNFVLGGSGTAGLQYNFSRHFSVEFHISFMLAPGWYYDNSDESSEPYNYLYYEIYEDTIDYVIAASGENYMDLTNVQIGLAPRYYFLPGKKINPFLLAGVTLNYTDVYFENNEYEAYKDLGRENEYEGNYELENWFDYHVGVGIKAGAGAEFVISDNIGLFTMATYDFIPLKESAFVYEAKYAEFHALSIHLGARFSFLKSKEL